MKFIDEVKITVISGDGGPGSVSFRREKFVPFGGPDGGNGGRGAHVYFIVNRNLNTLMHFSGRRVYKAEDGGAGAGSQCDGRAGEDLYLQVPEGTVIKNALTGEPISDLLKDGQVFIVARGGQGGLGNAYFKSSTNQTPRFAQSGKPGESFEIQLELKLLADIGLVGLPNAGKSTLISVISASRPKIADYPFTTLVPNLGVVQVGEKTIVVADVPGLIEDANLGKGLGTRFLKHLERTKALVHLVDCSMCVSPFEAFDQYVTIKNELLKYSDELGIKREIVCLTKIDAMTEEEIAKFQDYFEAELQKKVMPISAVSGRNIPKLKILMLEVKELLDNAERAGETGNVETPWAEETVAQDGILATPSEENS